MLLFGPPPPGCAAVTLVSHCQGDWELCIILFWIFLDNRILSSFHFEFLPLIVSSFSAPPFSILFLLYIMCDISPYFLLFYFIFVLSFCACSLSPTSLSSLSIVTRELTVLQYLPHILDGCGYVNLLQKFPWFRVFHSKYFCAPALLYSILLKKHTSLLIITVLYPYSFILTLSLIFPALTPFSVVSFLTRPCVHSFTVISLIADHTPVTLPVLPPAPSTGISAPSAGSGATCRSSIALM